MNRIIAALIAGVFAVAGASVYAADTAKAAGDPGSADTKATSGKKTVKAQGGPCAPGAGDSSAAAKGKPQGGDVKCAPEGAAAKEPGRSGDPASAEKKK